MYVVIRCNSGGSKICNRKNPGSGASELVSKRSPVETWLQSFLRFQVVPSAPVVPRAQSCPFIWNSSHWVTLQKLLSFYICTYTLTEDSFTRADHSFYFFSLHNSLSGSLTRLVFCRWESSIAGLSSLEKMTSSTWTEFPSVQVSF